MALAVHLKELATGFRRLKKYASQIYVNNTFDACACLHTLYAIECGLKVLHLSATNIENSDKLFQQNNQLKTHDIRLLNDVLKHSIGVNVPQYVLSEDKEPYRSLRPPKNRIPIKNFHEALRYGIRINDPDLGAKVQRLVSLCNEIETRFTREGL